MPEAGSLLRRFGAILYDAFVLAALAIGITGALLIIRRAAIEPGTWWYQLLLGAVLLTYFAGFWWRRGQTVGMVAWQLHVVGEDGGRVTLTRALVRAFVAPLSWAAAGLGFLWSLVDREQRTWHDLASHTRLVRMALADPGNGEQHGAA